MRKAGMIALLAVGSSLALYAGINQPEAKAEKAQTDCCDKTECCPMGDSDECCEAGCE